MPEESTHHITQLLVAAGDGDDAAQKKLWSVIYTELHRLAQGQMANEAPNRTLQTTSLVHEAYLRLFGNQNIKWENRRHFFGSAARAMRQILIEDARRRATQKRGGARKRSPLDEADALFNEDPSRLLGIDEALNKLEHEDPRKAEVVMLRFFAGLNVEETAAALDVSPRTIESDWRFTRAWLRRELSETDAQSE